MRGKGRKNLTQNQDTMNTLLEKVLTDRSAREPEEMETLSAAQEPFDSWD